MNIRNSLLGGAALGALFAMGFGAAAEAKPVKHHVRHPVISAEAAEIHELQDEVKSLTSRLDAEETARQQAQAQVQEQAQAAQTQAQAAVTQVQAVQAQADTQIKTIPTQVQTAVAAIPKPKMGWWGDTSISGRMYSDITDISQKSDGVKQPTDGVNFDLKRFYISVDHTFNQTFSADITTDVTYDSGPAAATQIFIKKAYLQAKASDAFTVRLGAADLPWVPFVEDIYGYRYVENLMIDRTKFGTTTDWGVHVLGKLPMGMVTVNYALSAVDGNGYKKPGFIAGVNRSKGIDVEGRLSATAGNFTAAVGGYSGTLGHDIEGVTTYNTAQRFDALIAYVDKRIRIGGEYFYAKDWNDVTQANPLLTNSSEGYSVFGSYKVTDKVGLFGRYDWVKPKRDTAPTFEDNYFNVGISYEPVKIVDFALVYKRDKVDNGLLSTSNGIIGGVNSGTYDEFGLWTQFRW